jgi:hypothetical protein
VLLASKKQARGKETKLCIVPLTQHLTAAAAVVVRSSLVPQPVLLLLLLLANHNDALLLTHAHTTVPISGLAVSVSSPA